MPPGTTIRSLTLEDLDVLLAAVQAGFNSYTAFAPMGWQPPDAFAGRALAAERLADPSTTALIAVTDGEPVGHISFYPGQERSAGRPPGHPDDRPVIPGLAHLWQLFVLPAWWGRGVAPRLHDAGVNEMEARGFASARLFTPSLHARARRFYERRDWSPTAEEWNDDLSLMLTEYRRPLTITDRGWRGLGWAAGG